MPRTHSRHQMAGKSTEAKEISSKNSSKKIHNETTKNGDSSRSGLLLPQKKTASQSKAELKPKKNGGSNNMQSPSKPSKKPKLGNNKEDQPVNDQPEPLVAYGYEEST